MMPHFFVELGAKKLLIKVYVHDLKLILLENLNRKDFP